MLKSDFSTTTTPNNTLTVGNNSLLEGRKTLHFDGFVPWNNPDNLVSPEAEAFAERLKSAIVLPLLFLIGGPANVMLTWRCSTSRD